MSGVDRHDRSHGGTTANSTNIKTWVQESILPRAGHSYGKPHGYSIKQLVKPDINGIKRQGQRTPLHGSRRKLFCRFVATLQHEKEPHRYTHTQK